MLPWKASERDIGDRPRNQLFVVHSRMAEHRVRSVVWPTAAGMGQKMPYTYLSDVWFVWRIAKVAAEQSPWPEDNVVQFDLTPLDQRKERRRRERFCHTSNPHS